MYDLFIYIFVLTDLLIQGCPTAASQKTTNVLLDRRKSSVERIRSFFRHTVGGGEHHKGNGCCDIEKTEIRALLIDYTALYTHFQVKKRKCMECRALLIDYTALW